MKYQSNPYNLQRYEDASLFINCIPDQTSLVLLASRSGTIMHFIQTLEVVEDEDMLYAMSLSTQAPLGGHAEMLALGNSPHCFPVLIFSNFSPLSSDPEAHGLAQDIPSVRTTTAFSHNQHFLPNEYTDTTRVSPWCMMQIILLPY